MAETNIDSKSKSYIDTNTEEKLRKKEKPQYSIPSNIAFMVKRAWKGHKLVLVICLSIAFLTFAKTVIDMLIAPMILQDNWINRDGAIDEVRYIHTSAGYDLNYAFVIK